MSCWRVLELTDSADDKHIPQLLIKPRFGPADYAVFLTDLSNVWSEELDLDGIVERTAQQQAPIEVSTQDTSQLDILLQHVQKSLDSNDGTVCRIAKDADHGMSLHTQISLPEPLGPLRWRFNLRKRTDAVLKDELILPLLVSSHIQHERISGLLSIVHEKDKAITRLVDQFESSNLDLASAFPSLGGARAGRKLVKREQAARHVPALQPFDDESWKEETCQLKDDHLSTLGLFQEALSECAPKVPMELKSEDEGSSWWTAIQSKIDATKLKPKSQRKAQKSPVKAASVHGDEETETEDEFETHANFKPREAAPKAPSAQPAPPITVKRPRTVIDDDSSMDDEDDLDAPPKSQSQRQSQSQARSPPRQQPAKEPTPDPVASPPPKAVAITALKSRRFRIGGPMAKRTSPSPAPEANSQENGDDVKMTDVPAQSQNHANVDATTPRAKRTFKIGAKNRAASQDSRAVLNPTRSPSSSGNTRRTSRDQSPSLEAASRYEPASRARTSAIREVGEEEREETAEEKAERKRRELKRKNEELAKKRTHKKKRF